MKLEISGGKQLTALADALRDAGNKKLSQQLDRGSRSAGRVIGEAAQANPDPYIPRGFEREFKSALEYKVEVRLARGRRISVVFFAKGRKGNPRHIDEIEAGRLAHPIFGRTRRVRKHWKYGAHFIDNPWVKPPQRIRRGVITEPGLRAVPKAVDQIQDAANAVAEQINNAI